MNTYPQLTKEEGDALVDGLVYVGVGRDEISGYYPLFKFNQKGFWEPEYSHPDSIERGRKYVALLGSECANHYRAELDAQYQVKPVKINISKMLRTQPSLIQEIGEYTIDTGQHPSEWNKVQDYFTSPPFYGMTVWQLAITLDKILFFIDDTSHNIIFWYPGSMKHETGGEWVSVGGLNFELKTNDPLLRN